MDKNKKIEVINGNEEDLKISEVQDNFVFEEDSKQSTPDKNNIVVPEEKIIKNKNQAKKTINSDYNN